MPPEGGTKPLSPHDAGENNHKMVRSEGVMRNVTDAIAWDSLCLAFRKPETSPLVKIRFEKQAR